MPGKESLEDTIRRILGEHEQQRAQHEQEEKDPKAWLEGMTRRVFNEEFDKRLNEGRPRRTSRDEGDDDDDQGEGFFAKLVGGGGR